MAARLETLRRARPPVRRGGPAAGDIIRPPMHRPRQRAPLAAGLALLFLVPAPAAAQPATLRADVTIYGDDTEFFNPFREGETLLGAAGTVGVDLALTERATLRGGLFLNHRYGSARFAEQWRPVISLTVENGPSRFVFGTLDTVPDDFTAAPDRGGPHGLLPPLQVETLAFTRPHEGGLQWQVAAARLTQDAWLNWQRLNTAEQRERFDAGVRGRLALGAGAWVGAALGYQFHVVHEGGQLFDPGPVADSAAGGPGLVLEPRIGFFDAASIETYVMWAQHVPDRAAPERTDHGHGLFLRAAASKRGWRGHAILWRACLWLKEEGDVNYGSRLEDGTVFRATRRYGEVGVSKAFYEADGVMLAGSLRLHRIERSYDYSFRVLARVGVALPLSAP